MANSSWSQDIISPESLRLVPLEHAYVSYTVRSDQDANDPITDDAVALLYARSIKPLKCIGVCKKSRKYRVHICSWLEPGETHRWRVLRTESPTDGVETVELEALEETSDAMPQKSGSGRPSNYWCT